MVADDVKQHKRLQIMSTKKVPISYAYRPVVVVDANGKKKVMYEKFHPITTGNAVVIDGKTLKNKLKEYYDKGEVDALLKALKDALDAIKGLENATEAIDSLNEIIAFLDTFKNDKTLANVLASLMEDMEEWVEAKGYLTQHQSLAGKQDVISDLSTIRSGAAAGATAVQPAAISDMETKTHASATYQPKGNYLTQHQTLPTSLPANGGNADTVDGYHFVVGSSAGTAANTIYFVV